MGSAGCGGAAGREAISDMIDLCARDRRQSYHFAGEGARRKSARRTRSAGGGNGERGGAVAQPARIFAFIDVDNHQRRAGDAVAASALAR